MRVVRLRVPAKYSVTRNANRFPINRLLPVFILIVIVSTTLLVTLPHVLLINQHGSYERRNFTFPGTASRRYSAVGFRNCSGSNQRRCIGMKKSQQQPTSKGKAFKLEQLIDRNVMAVQLNFVKFWRQINDKRFQTIIKHYFRSNDNYTWPNVTCNLEDEDRFIVQQLCPLVPPNLVGPIAVTADHTHDNDRVDAWLNKSQQDICPGGRWRPKECDARHRVAIIIPYRDRKEHVNMLLAHLHPILQRQQLDYRIFVVEQFDNGTFNKGILMNAAFLLSSELGPAFQCYVFHDVDLLPEDDRNMYSCPSFPRHMSVSVDQFKYILPYSGLVGGVFSIRTDHFLLLNGYSNLYWGWGGEDDDLYER
ncbi:hypothetical protein CHUAL_002137 [Chamberlinius hualienensis]